MKGRILFVSHQASRSGAPLMLLHFLRWLRDNTAVEPHVLLAERGELASEFAAVAPVISVQRPSDQSGPTRLLRRLGWADEVLQPRGQGDLPLVERAIRMPARKAIVGLLARQLARLGPLDLVHLNTTSSARALPLISSRIPVLTHAHELEPLLDELRQSAPWAVEAIVTRTDRYVAASGAVARALIERYEADPAKIGVCHEFIPIPEAVDPATVAAAREDLGLDPHTFVIGAVGTIGWRKASDIFLLVARRLLQLVEGRRRVRFVWIGAPPRYDSWSLPQLMHDVQSLGLAGCVDFVGSQSDPLPIMSLFDVLMLPSRSDPYPLVCLEAAALGKPIVCFDAGGMAEFLQPAERLVLPYLDINAMATRLAELIASDAERTSLGQRLSTRVRSNHSIEVAAPRLLHEMDVAMRTKATARVTSDLR